MRIDARVTRCARHGFPISALDVLLCLFIDVALCKTEINDVQSTFCLLSTTHQEVIRFDVSVQVQVFVHHLDADQQLLAQHAHSFQAEFMVALNVVSLKRFAEQL